MTLLSVRGLAVRYGRTEAVHGIDLDLAAGQIVCLIGGNGAGKTSTLRALSGLRRPAAGRVLFGGVDVAGWAPHRLAAAGMAHVPEGRQVFTGLTVGENLALGAWTARDAATVARRRAAVLDRFPRLRERLAQVAGLLSGGEQQMLAIGRALMAAPRLLLLDEPSMGLAPQVEDEIFAIVATLAQGGTTVLLVEQNASAALDISDVAYVLEGGRIVLHGPAAEVAHDPAVMVAYLGG